MKILITGFAPFGGEELNPSYEAVKGLPDVLPDIELIKLELPVSFQAAPAVLDEALASHRPDAVLCAGQAGGRPCVTIERVAINLAEARIPDNDGFQPSGEPLVPGAPAAYFATLPVKAMVQNVRAHALPCNLSYTAGTYVCNGVMYHALHLAATKYPGLLAGFVHVPFADFQTVNKPSSPSASLQSITGALRYALEAIANPPDCQEAMGNTH